MASPLLQSETPGERFIRILKTEAMLIMLIVLCVALWLKVPLFLSTGNLLVVLRTVSILGVIAFGMTMVIIAGEIDLSVGSMATLAGCAATTMLIFFDDRGWHPAAAAIVALLAVSAIGLSGGALIATLRNVWRVPSFITSLALFTGLQGVSQLTTNGFSVTTVPKWILFLGSGSVLGVPAPVIIFLCVFAATHFLMNHTVFGRMVYAVGGNAEAARLSGVPVGKVRAAVLMITGLLAVLGGLMETGKLRSAVPTGTEPSELDIIAAVIIGGASLSGGSGRIWGTFVGVLFAGVIANGMTLLNLPQPWQLVVRGALILFAVLMNQALQPKTGRE